MNDSIKQNFLSVINQAIAEAEHVISDARVNSIFWLEEDGEVVKRNFEMIKARLVAGDLPKSNGAGLGITRGLSEMGVPESLYKAGKLVEDFYLSNWN